MQTQIQKGPLSPQELLSRLIGQNYKQIECENSQQKYIIERQLLLQLICEYEQSVEKQMIRQNQLEGLQSLRLRLTDQLERTKREREIIEEEISQEIIRLQEFRNKELQDRQKVSAELSCIRQANCKLRLKLKDLYGYVQKLQLHNRRLQEERRISRHTHLQRLKMNSQSWLGNVQSMRRTQQSFQNELRNRLKEKQAFNLNQIRRQQEEIMLRNRQRWDSFIQRSSLLNGQAGYHYSSQQYPIYTPLSRRY